MGGKEAETKLLKKRNNTAEESRKLNLKNIYNNASLF